jgi:hypothetical protein
VDVVMGRALEEAIEHGHSTAGLPQVVLALLDDKHPSTAQDALRAVGVSRQLVEDRDFASFGPQGSQADSEGRRAAGSEPLWHETAARAQGLAVGFGKSLVTPEHVLLAMLWQRDQRWFEDVLAAAGSSRESLLEALRDLGVQVPEVPLPPVPPPMTQFAGFPKPLVQEVTWALRSASPPTGHWGIGPDPTDDNVMIAIAADDVPLEEVLDEVVGSGRWSWKFRDADQKDP